MYLEQFRLDGRVAVVNGSAQGIGYCVAEALAEADAVVTIGDRDARALGQAQGSLATKEDVADEHWLNVLDVNLNGIL